MRVWMRLSVERERRAALAIFAISFLWGMTFIWMKQGIEAAEVASPDLDANWVAILFFSARFVIATALTLAILPKARTGLRNPDAVRGGMWLGLILSAGYLSQNVGITTVTPGVSAFLTSLYVVFTALIAISLGRQSITRSTVIGVVLATGTLMSSVSPPVIRTVVSVYEAKIGCSLRVMRTTRPLAPASFDEALSWRQMSA